MKIHEVEEKTGLTRANVRFYEKEGLLNPARKSNGYRDYSEEDVEVLLKVKLLRELRVSLEDIAKIQRQEVSLEDTIGEHIQRMDEEIQNIQGVGEVCQNMWEENACYEKLDAEKYLRELRKLCPNITTEADVYAETPHPWRRYFARALDVCVYGLIYWAVVYGGLKLPVPDFESWQYFIGASVRMFVLILVLEPLCLRLFGTTFGKWIFGIRVTDRNGKNLSYADAFIRTAKVLWYGAGLYLPGLYEIRMFFSYDAYAHGKTLRWDENCVYTFKDDKNVRCAVAAVLLIILEVFSEVYDTAAVYFPKHKGELTTVEFTENYNHFLENQGMYKEKNLTDEGEWEPGSDIREYVSEEGAFPPGFRLPPDFTFEEADGAVTAVRFQYVYEGTDVQSGFYDELSCAAYAMIFAQEDSRWWDGSREKTAEYMEAHRLENYSFEEHGVRIEYQVRTNGYKKSGNWLSPETEGKDGTVEVIFSAEKI